MRIGKKGQMEKDEVKYDIDILFDKTPINFFLFI